MADRVGSAFYRSVLSMVGTIGHPALVVTWHQVNQGDLVLWKKNLCRVQDISFTDMGDGLAVCTLQASGAQRSYQVRAEHLVTVLSGLSSGV